MRKGLLFAALASLFTECRLEDASENHPLVMSQSTVTLQDINPRLV